MGFLNGPIVDAATYRDKATPLHDAARGGNSAVCGVLLQRGANKRAKNAQNKPPDALATNDQLKALIQNFS